MPKSIDAETVKGKLDRGERFHLVETLMPKEYEEWHLPGAINIHFNKIGREAKERFAPEEEIVVYCHDEACRASVIAAEKLEKMGFANVYDFEGGKAAWKEAGYPVEE